MCLGSRRLHEAGLEDGQAGPFLKECIRGSAGAISACITSKLKQRLLWISCVVGGSGRSRGY